MDKKRAKVAIITRTKDRPQFLKRAIKTIEQQTYSDYIHVIFNDGGDKEKIEAIVGKNTQNRVLVHSESIGLVKALNKAIQSVDSDYIAILDDDDTWAPERLEKTIAYLDQTKEKAVVVKMDIVIEEVDGDTIRFVSQSLHPQSGEGEISLFKQCYQNYVSNGVITYGRDVYDELGGYDETLGTAEDWDFGIRLLMKYDVAFLRNEPSLFFYHQRPTQKGGLGNSVHAGVEQQEKTINALRNRYLRSDLAAGKLGVGYIMNSLAQDEQWVVRLEGHANYLSSSATDRIEAEIVKSEKEVKEQLYMPKLMKRIRGNK